MLQTLHDRFSGIAAKILLGVVVIVFGGFFGIEQYMNPKTDTFVAKVGDKEIGQDQFREAYNRYRSQAQQAYGAQFDAAAKRKSPGCGTRGSLFGQAGRLRGVAPVAMALRPSHGNRCGLTLALPSS